jgi:hypothetical protein
LRPFTPTGVTATNALCDRIEVSWNPVFAATTYAIYRNTINDSASANYYGYSLSPYIDYSAVPGTAYYYWVRAKTYSGVSGFSVSAAGYRPSQPVITQHPQNTTAYAGGNAGFSVVASGSEPLHYQWKKNDANVGTDNSTLMLTDVQISDNGARIYCDISNNCGSVTSNAAILTILPAQFTITASAGLNGMVEPNGVFDIDEGSDVNFTAEPNFRYTVDSWYLDSNSVQAGGAAYTLHNVQSSHSVYVTFRTISWSDFNGDGIVNFEDFAILASNWLSNCSEPDWCEGSDIDRNGLADIYDLMRFSEDWLLGG